MRYLFCPLASHGYVYPAIGIARELRARGHSIAFATDGSFGAALASQGFERIPRGSRDGMSFQVTAWGETHGLEWQIKHVRHAVETFEPDAILASQLAWGCVAAAHAAEIPVSILGFATHIFPHSDAMLANPSNPREHLHKWRYEGMMNTYAQACAIAGIQPHPSVSIDESPLLGEATLLQCVPEFLGNLPPLPSRVQCIGSCVWEPPESDAELTSWLEQSPRDWPLLYVQHGRAFAKESFWPYLIQCLADRPVRVVAVTSRMDKPVGSPPRNFFVRHHIPQGQILPHARAIICNATSTAVLGGLTHGLPMLLVPGGSSQPELAEQCEMAGISITLDHKLLDGAMVSGAVDRALEDSAMRENSCKIAAAFARICGFSRAADALISLASREGKAQPACVS
jgi:MGT family glycosyltransferase